MVVGILTVLALAAIAGLGAFAIWWSHPSNEARRLLSESPQKRLDELVAGDRARVRGIARRGAEIKTSPLTLRRCIGYRFIIERLERNGLWGSLGEWDDCATFELRADEGVALVEGPFLMGLEFDADGGDGGNLLTPAVSEAIERLTKADHHPFRPTFRFREAILEDGDPIWVRGIAALSVDPRGMRESARGQPVLPVIRGTVHDPTVLADAEPPGIRTD